MQKLAMIPVTNGDHRQETREKKFTLSGQRGKVRET
jgi:hypothetical protein